MFINLLKLFILIMFLKLNTFLNVYELFAKAVSFSSQELTSFCIKSNTSETYEIKKNAVST